MGNQDEGQGGMRSGGGVANCEGACKHYDGDLGFCFEVKH